MWGVRDLRRGFSDIVPADKYKGGDRDHRKNYRQQCFYLGGEQFEHGPKPRAFASARGIGMRLFDTCLHPPVWYFFPVFVMYTVTSAMAGSVAVMKTAAISRAERVQINLRFIAEASFYIYPSSTTNGFSRWLLTSQC